MSAKLMKRLAATAAICIFPLACVDMAAADEPAKPPREGIAKIDDYADQAKTIIPWVTLGAGASFSYQYDFERPENHHTIPLRLVDKDHDAFGLDLAQLTIKHDVANPGDFGFMLQPAFGRFAKRFKSDWDGSGAFNDTKWENNEVEIQQVYLAYDVPVGNGVTLKLGKFNTLVGSEVNEPWNNPEYSRQYLYSLGQPATHTGGLASYTINDMFSVTMGGIQGWDVVDDNNGKPSFIGQLGITLSPQYVFYLTTIIGPEIPNNGSDLRYMFDYVSTIKPFGDNFAIISNLDYDVEQGSSATRPSKDSTFWGVSTAFDYTVLPGVDLVYRVEWFEDADAIRTGTRQRVWEMTGDARWKITDYLYVRAEYRHDESDHKPFISGDTVTSPGQDTVAGEFGYAF